MPLRRCKNANCRWSKLGEISCGQCPVAFRGGRAAANGASHVRDYGMAAAEDDAIFEFAAREQRMILSADTDFAAILSLR
jgi:hypothetical protein